MSFQINTPWHTLDGAELVTSARDALVRVLFHEKKMGRTNQAKIAEKIGVDRSVINRQLTGAADISVSRVGEIASILGRKVEFRISGNPLDEVGRNLRAVESQGGTNQSPMGVPIYNSDGILINNSSGSKPVERAR